MKKFVLIIFALMMATAVNAQWQFINGKMILKPYTARVGIGTDKPIVPFHVVGASKFVGAMSVTGVTTHIGNLNVTGNITATGSITPNTTPDAGSFTTILGSGLETLSGTSGIKFSSTAMVKGIDFTGTQLGASQEDAAFAYGTWTAPIYVIGHTAHYAPIQVNLHVSSSAAKDVTGIRVRVDSDADTACTLTAMQGLEMRAAMKGAAIGSHTLAGVSTSVDAATTCTGDFLAGYFNIQGTGAVTSSNHINVLEATNTNTSATIKNVAHFTENGTAGTISDILKVENIAGTATNLAEIVNTSGTATNGLSITGTYGGNAITTTGTAVIGGMLSENGGTKTSAYQEIDSVSGTSITAGKRMVGYWSHAVGNVDTVCLANMVVGEFITIIKLGSAGAAGGTKLVVKAPATLVNLTAVFYPTTNTNKTGLSSFDITQAIGSKTFYKMDATHIWVY